MAKFEEEKVINALHPEKRVSRILPLLFPTSTVALAEEILQTKGSMTFCAKGCGYTEKVKELIAIGLTEGRREGYELGCNEKFENTYMKAEEFDKYLELATENEQLKERIREVENDSNNCEHWSYTRIKQLEEQIEKMKCCENCIHWCEGRDECLMGGSNTCNNNEIWELNE